MLVASLAAGLAPRTFAHRLSTRQLGDLTGAASGLLLASALLVVVPEGFHTAAESAEESGSADAFAYSPVVLGVAILAGFVLMFVALLTLIGTMISDLLLVLLDPRIRYGARGT